VTVRRWLGRAVGWSVIGLLLLVVVLLAGSRDARFVVRAAWEEMRILLAREDLAALVAAEGIPTAERAKFQLVLDARAFAADSLGLEAGRTFTQFSRLPRDTLVLVLSASPRDQLVAHTWWFPVVGRVPYRGYFDLADAEAAADRLADCAYDTYLRPAAAFSTLGWFEDPLLSTSLRSDPVTLAELVIHEITHNTVWVRGAAEFNESLASYIGLRGAEAFFAARGDSVNAWRGAMRRRDEARLGELHALLVRELEELYRAGLPLDTVLARREVVFARARERYRSTPFEVYDGRRLAAGPLNNATIVAMRTYRTDTQVFADALARFADLRAFVRALDDALARRGKDDPFDVVRRLRPAYY
jgi:predicted aminopeptidase